MHFNSLLIKKHLEFYSLQPTLGRILYSYVYVMYSLLSL